MAERFVDLSESDQREALLVAADRTGRPAYLLEKDVWVVWTLNALFSAPFGEHLVFKGGTSLSKGFGGLIDRFSEDVDLTYDIRALNPELAALAPNPIPSTRSQAKKWVDKVRANLPTFIAEQVVPWLRELIDRDGVPLKVRYDATGADPDKVFLDFKRQFDDAPDYVAPAVRLEFGSRSSGEPAETQAIQCDAAPAIPELEFPRASARVMAAERTFLEKATAAHAYCIQGRFRGDKFARHWHDLERLHVRGYSRSAIADPDLPGNVAEHKTMFFPEPGVDYQEAVTGGLRLVPNGAALAALRAEYDAMVAGGLLHSKEGDFNAMMDGCAEIETLVNDALKPSSPQTTSEGGGTD
jgi:hypothetical protein